MEEHNGQTGGAFEIGCKDKTATAKFYSELFDWSTHELGPAAMISTGSEKGIPGHITSSGHEPHNYTILDVEVEDVAAAIKKAESLGGKMLVPPVPIPTGKSAWIADQEGNTVGLFEVTPIGS